MSMKQSRAEHWWERVRYVGEGEYGPKYEYQGADKMSANDVQVGGSHYKDMKVQPWDALEAWLTPEEFKGYLRASAIAYLARAGHKDPFLQDVKKAHHYLAKLIEVEGQ